MDRPLTGALTSEYSSHFTAGVQQFFNRFYQVRLPVNHSRDLGNSRTTNLLRTFKGVETLCLEAKWRSRNFNKSSKTSLKISHIPASVMVCIEEIWHSAWPGGGKNWLLWPRGHTFCKKLCTFDWTQYSKLDLMMRVIFQTVLKSCKTLMTLITDVILEDLEDFLTLRWISMDWPTGDAIFILEIHRWMTWWIISPYLNFFDKILIWKTATHYWKPLELPFDCELCLKYFTCVKKWRALNHPPFSVKIVCFVSSCGVYALDDH